MKTPAAMCAAVLLLFAAVSPSPAAITEPIITLIVADTTAMTLKIVGFNLPEGAVYMGKQGGGVQRLDVNSASATAIEAQLPTTVPGTYIVAIALSEDEFWTSSVTVGAAGPQGPRGPEGPEGPPGAKGDPGPAGPGTVKVLYLGNSPVMTFPATLSSANVYCVVGPHIAGSSETAMMHVSASYEHSTTQKGMLSAAFSDDGGTLWQPCTIYPAIAGNAANSPANMSQACAFDLLQGNSYLFGIMTLDGNAAGFTPDAYSHCHNMVEVARW